MAGYPWYPASYQPTIPQYSQPATPTPVQTAPPQSGILWVQGEAGAKSYMLAPGQSVLLMDSEAQQFFIKTADQSGMPMPLRTFTYTEVTAGQNAPHPDYVTRDELEARLAALAGKEAVPHE